jgi:hypothetical protein
LRHHHRARSTCAVYTAAAAATAIPNRMALA